MAFLQVFFLLQYKYIFCKRSINIQFIYIFIHKSTSTTFNVHFLFLFVLNFNTRVCIGNNTIQVFVEFYSHISNIVNIYQIHEQTAFEFVTRKKNIEFNYRVFLFT